MANWCFNKVKISGEEDSLKKISQIIKQKLNDNEIGLMESLVGREPNITEEEYNNDGWYEANLNYWGVKWDIEFSELVFIDNKDFILLEFETVWGYPKGFCEILSKNYKVNVTIKYYEPGNIFCGIFELNELGKIIKDISYDNILEGLYNYGKLEFWDHIENLIEDERIVILEKDDAENFINENLSFLTLSEIKKIKNLIIKLTNTENERTNTK
jgi:hypothetical protein